MGIEMEWLEMFIDLQLIGGTLLAAYMLMTGKHGDSDDD